ncbi:hypothetical protein FSARC_11579 [Fusarium sarcochroum]|uniref:Uncharacterized protein n=1 Tax=Fusarium sarcochroum TaxID=1208366 RepID=A0A8H4TEE1_9HYPO|nr:hypothetical protein FSARC_11579 [Fusarium sarcochroum]
MPKAKSTRRVNARTRPLGVRSSSRVKAAHSSSEQPQHKKQLKQIDEDNPSSSQTTSSGSGSSFNSSVPLNNNNFSSFSSEEHDTHLQTRELPSQGATNLLTNGGGLISPSDSALQFSGQESFGAPAGWSLQLINNVKSETAGEVALKTFGDNIKIDSALCKKLSNEAALRPVKQRRTEITLNMERRSNVEAFLAHLTGVPVSRACKNCSKGHGPWHECIIYDGQMCGSCTNCWFNASGSRCTFHETNHPSSVYPPRPAYNLPSAGMPQQHPELPPMFLQPPVISHPNASLSLIQESSATPYISPPDQELPTINMIERHGVNALTDVVSMTRQERFLARIESAAEQLGLCLAEYDEYLNSPEGRASQESAESATHTTSSDASMEDAASDESQPR